jgi:hypothetical protein
MDGREIHFSSSRVGLIDFSWNTKGNHVLKVVCHASAPMTPTPGFRQYDLLINGQSFFRMPKVFELGVKGIAALDDHRSSGAYGEVGSRSAYGGDGGYGGYSGSDGYGEPPVRGPRTPSEEDLELQRAIQASLEESKLHLSSGSSKAGESAPDMLSESPAPANVDLLGFDSGPAPSSFPAILPDSPANYSNAPPASFASPGQPYGGAPQQPYAALPPSQPPYGSPPPPAYGTAPAPYGAAPPAAYGAGPPASYGAPPSQEYLALPPSQPPYGSPPAATQPPQQQWTPPPAQPSQYVAQPSYGNAYAGYATEDPFAPKAPSHHDIASDILKAYGGGTPTSATNGPVYGSPQPTGYYQPGQPFPTSAETTPMGYSQEQSNGSVATLSMNKLTLTDSDETPKNPFEATLKKLVNIDHIDQPADEQIKLTMKQQEDERAKKNRNKSVPLPPAAARVVGSGATLKDIAKVKPPVKMEPVMAPPPGLYTGEASTALVAYGQGPPPLQPRGFGVVHMQGQYR